jgi:hypothetical protein
MGFKLIVGPEAEQAFPKHFVGMKNEEKDWGMTFSCKWMPVSDF